MGVWWVDGQKIDEGKVDEKRIDENRIDGRGVDMEWKGGEARMCTIMAACWVKGRIWQIF